MRPRTNTTTAPARATNEPAAALDQRLRPWLLGAAMALVVARPLLPSESVPFRGDDAPFALLWLCLAAVTALAAAPQARSLWRWCPTDAVLLLLVGLHVLSALVALPREAPRPTLNMLWVWIAAGAAYFTLRQLVRSTAEVRAAAAVMVGLALTLAAYGFFQYFVTLPATREAYAADPDGMLRAIGQWYPPGSPERMLFEQRLASTHPLATFALTNSLAGVLATWLVVGLAALLLPWRRLGTPRQLALVAVLLAIAWCLVLTKSRSGIVATLFGLGAWAWLYRPDRLRVGWKIPLLVLALFAALLAAGFATRSLDRQVLSEAPKSLGYRLQYWEASAQMARDRCWLGYGPGNFKDHYTRYKSPTASEEVSDPHNFLVEIAATAGVPAALAMLVLLGVWARDLLRPAASPPPSATPHAFPWHVLGGGLTGFVLAALLPFIAGPLFEVPLSISAMLAGLAISGLVLALLKPWIERGELPPSVLALGGAVLLVHLLASGGIGYPGVAISLWLAIALSLAARHDHRPTLALPQPATLALAILLLASAVACYATAYRPLSESYRHLAVAHALPREAEQHLLAATEADPHGFEAPRTLAAWRFERWRHQGGSPDELFQAQHQWLARRPFSAEAFAQAGTWQSTVARQTRDDDLARAAVQSFRRAVDLYPHSPRLWAQLAIAAQAADQTDLAHQAAAEALRLDALTPHLDRKLTDDLRDRLPSPAT